MRLAQLIDGLEAYLRDELQAQGRLRDVLVRHESAILARDTEAIREAGSALERELVREPHRERCRKELLSRFAQAFGVAPSILSVRSILERARAHGAVGPEIDELRGELRTAIEDVRRHARKLSVVAKGHSELLTDVLRALVGEESTAVNGGILVDAEA